MGILAAQNMNFTDVAPVTHPEEMGLGRGQFAKEEKAREGFDEEDSL